MALVFVVSNSQCAISVPLKLQTASQPWRKRLAAGFCGERIDARDVIAVREAANEAIGRDR
jgi:pyruvate dehydrogenase E1 component alpha subunit